MSYRYAASDPRAARGRYFYTEFEGAPFLAAWAESRRFARSRLAAAGASVEPGRSTPERRIPEPGAEPVDTLSVLAAAEAATREWGGGAAAMGAGSRTPAEAAYGQAAADAAHAWLSVLTRKFEVGRVLRAGYGVDLAPLDRTEVAPDAYALLATLLARRAAATAGAPATGALSSLLKAGDLLDWIAADDIASLSARAAAAAAAAMATEEALVSAMVGRTPPRARPRSRGDARAWHPTDPGTVDGIPLPAGPVTLLAADTARARAYLDMLCREGLLPDRAVVVGLQGSVMAGAASGPCPTPLFDNVTPLAAALARAGVPTERLVVERFEDPAVLRALEDAGADLVIVAGPPGVILAPAFFDAGRSYLHVHPGRLPEYRGSTPMYYEYLAEGHFTATALVLDAGIDTGSTVGARTFDPPSDMRTIDQSFDPWMRAATLLDVIRARASGVAVTARPQATPGHTYHVIHPVLRHIALLSPSRSVRTARSQDAA